MPHSTDGSAAVVVIGAVIFKVVLFDKCIDRLPAGLGLLPLLGLAVSSVRTFVAVGKLAPVVRQEFGELRTTLPACLLVRGARMAGFVAVVAFALWKGRSHR